MSRSVRGPDYSLRVFEKHPHTEAYKVGGSFTPYAIVAVEKRFADAELAAEFHANEGEAWQMAGYRPEFYDVDRAEKLEHRSATFRRFATLPHFDE